MSSVPTPSAAHADEKRQRLNDSAVGRNAERDAERDAERESIILTVFCYTFGANRCYAEILLYGG